MWAVGSNGWEHEGMNGSGVLCKTELRHVACNGHPGQRGWVERRGQTVEAWSLCSSFGPDSGCHQENVVWELTFLNVSIISNCVKLPFPKGIPAPAPRPMAARALMLIGQIVFGFETQTVINETTVNELGPGWPLHLAFSCGYRFHKVWLCLFGHCAWPGEIGSLVWAGWMFWPGSYL